MRQNKNYLIWFFAALFYVYQFILRVSPNVIKDQLMASFELNAHGFGQLSAVAMYAYALLQLPSGNWADRFGVRRVLLSAIATCLLGNFLFSQTEHLAAAYVGRALIGAGSSAAFLCCSKLICELFPSHLRARLLGLTMMAGTIGALLGTAPLSVLSRNLGWQQSLTYIGLFGAVIFFCNFFLLKGSSSQKANHSLSLMKTLRLIRERSSWRYFAAGVVIYLPICVLGDVWGVSFLHSRFQLDPLTASQCASFLYVGLCLGSIFVPLAKDLTGRRSLIIQGCLWAIAILVCALLYLQLSLFTTSALLFAIGFFCGAEILCFDGACSEVQEELSASVTGLLNGLVMLSGAFLQEQTGLFLDWMMAQNAGSDLGDAKSQFTLAISLMVPFLFLGALSGMGLRESKL